MGVLSFRLPDDLFRALHARLASDDTSLRSWLTREARRMVEDGIHPVGAAVARTLASSMTRQHPHPRFRRVLAVLDDGLHRPFLDRLRRAGLSLQDWGVWRTAAYVGEIPRPPESAQAAVEMLRVRLSRLGLHEKDVRDIGDAVSAALTAGLLAPRDVDGAARLLDHGAERSAAAEEDVAGAWSIVTVLPRGLAVQVLRMLLWRTGVEPCEVRNPAQS